MKPHKPTASSSSSSTSSISSSSQTRQKKQGQNKNTKKKGGVHVKSRHRIFWAPRGSHNHATTDKQDTGIHALALPLGMSFAAIVSKVLDGTNGSRDQIPIEQLSLICTLAVKESVSNIYGDRFDCFLMHFEKSFGSTLRTLRLINETSSKGNRSSDHAALDDNRNSAVSRPPSGEQGSITYSSHMSSRSCEADLGNHESLGNDTEGFQANPPLMSMNNQVILHQEINHELIHASHSFNGHGFGQSILSTFEKSVMEQTRSNDLKAFEIGLIKKKLELKESQLALSSYANMLEKVKITMGISKAAFNEEKLRNKMLDARHAELLKRCIDLLLGGLIIMSTCLVSGTFIYSYQHIRDATSSCSATPKESKSRWIPNPMASFSSGWHMLSCHVIALSRMSFGLLMVLAIAYSILQRSTMSGPTTMPVTFILIMLGVACGVAGKLCVDTLGGNGYLWLIYWETLCMLHFFANVFPSALYRVLYGCISLSERESRAGRLIPYCLRRSIFYFLLLFILPMMAGLLPFASYGDWTELIFQKITLWTSAQIED